MVRKGGRTHVYTPTKTKAWEDAVAWQIRAALRAGEPIAGDVAVELAFYREKNHRADLDNLVKAVSDAMNGLVYRDDAQIVRYQSSVQYGVEHPGVRVVVRAA
jgi:Holliday junction resolvase RusA-like endonuclease